MLEVEEFFNAVLLVLPLLVVGLLLGGRHPLDALVKVVLEAVANALGGSLAETGVGVFRLVLIVVVFVVFVLVFFFLLSGFFFFNVLRTCVSQTGRSNIITKKECRFTIQVLLFRSFSIPCKLRDGLSRLGRLGSGGSRGSLDLDTLNCSCAASGWNLRLPRRKRRLAKEFRQGRSREM